jgi:NAD(P)-dependent dehydrogenase (short-subunit alcohol dehydrogenase family)
MSGPAIVVTGAAGALGRAVAARLAEGGARVAAIDHAPQAPEGAKVALHLGGIDLRDPQAARAALDRVASELGGIDGLANIAGGFAWETIAEGDPETWDRLYFLNVKTALNASRAALPHLREGGAIVNVGAASAAKAELGMGAYAASKSGVARLTESLAAELKGKGIRVNAVLPSIIDTPANRADMPDADHGRWVRPGELAEVIAFLLSPAASAVTGAAIPVTGPV